ncbi:MAG: Gfo/Idh/MocA family oxidoreductase [Kiritimatiellales bacterium]|nr:Gfo/Idh/MocA family oxidoreductase [Kiritimatiellales bacterium]
MANIRTAAISRRNLLRNSAVSATAAVAAPYIIPSSALGLGGFTAPSERLTLAMIGHGIMMRGHFGAMLGRSDVQILAVCDVDRTKREEAKAKVEAKYAEDSPTGSYKGCEAYLEHERIMARDDIDACFVATPDHWHVPIALDAVRSGKDVYVEKPMSLTIREGRTLSDAVRRNGAVLQVGSQQRSDRAFRKAAEMVRNGWIGKVHTIYARLGGGFPPPRVLPVEPIPDGFDYDRWLGSTPWFPYNLQRVEGNFGGGWRSFWEYGSRKNGDWGAHHYDIIQWALGMDASAPAFFFPKGHEGSEWQGFTYADGPVVYKDHPAESNQMIEFHGDQGMVAVSRGGNLITTPAEFANKPLDPSEVHLYDSASHHQNFLDCIRTRKRPIADVEIGHRSATVCHLSTISERLNRTINWNPAKEEIIGDAEASKWLERPRRAPYTL